MFVAPPGIVVEVASSVINPLVVNEAGVARLEVRSPRRTPRDDVSAVILAGTVELELGDVGSKSSPPSPATAGIAPVQDTTHGPVGFVTDRAERRPLSVA